MSISQFSGNVTISSHWKDLDRGSVCRFHLESANDRASGTEGYLKVFSKDSRGVDIPRPQPGTSIFVVARPGLKKIERPQYSDYRLTLEASQFQLLTGTMHVNSINLIGRVGRDIEVKHFQSGSKVHSWSMAVRNVRDKENAFWFNLECWKDLKPLEWIAKGDLIGVQGIVSTQSWSQYGDIRSKISILVQDIDVLSSKNKDQSQSAITDKTNWVSRALTEDEDIEF